MFVYGSPDGEVQICVNIYGDARTVHTSYVSSTHPHNDVYIDGEGDDDAYGDVDS